jgi:hypothetical protein
MSSQNVIPLSIVLSSEVHDSMGVCNEYFLHHRCRGRHNPCCKLPWATRLKRTSFPEEFKAASVGSPKESPDRGLSRA